MPIYQINLYVTAPDADRVQRWSRGVLTRAYDPNVPVHMDGPHLLNAPGSTAQQLPAHLLAVIVMPPYRSTACQTAGALLEAIPDHPELADELTGWAEKLCAWCRENHKFTGQPCTGGCHRTTNGYLT